MLCRVGARCSAEDEVDGGQERFVVESFDDLESTRRAEAPARSRRSRRRRAPPARPGSR